MAEIAPLRGILYDPLKADASRVIAPPYDVISEDERKALEERDPHNVVRLILPRGDGDEKYAGAAKTLEAWLAEGVLKRDARPTVYRYHQLFELAQLGGRKFVRRGTIAAVRMHDYGDRIILPHERTLRGPKEDRLKLMRAARAHFSQIFGLYRDPGLASDRLFEGVEATRPYLEGATADGTTHRLWRVTDRELIGSLGRALSPLKVYIADGHHRYETMLALRNELRAAAPGGNLSSRATPEFATFFLTNISDPGLVILPTHRLIHSLPSFDREAVFQSAHKYFAITAVEGGARDAGKLHQEIARSAEARPSFAVVVPGEDKAWLFAFNTTPEMAGLDGHRAVATLDVSLLHGLVLERVLGVDRAAQEAQANITYVKDTADALARVAAGQAQIGFIMNPTHVQHVLDVADAGETMPQKSTFFYPKIASGMVINPLDPDEDLERAV